MKQSRHLLALLGACLTFSTGALAANQTTVLQDCNGTLSSEEQGIHANAHGYVTIQTTRNGGAEVTVQLWDGARSYEYVVRSKGIVLGTFTTNRKGNGSLKVHVAKVSDLGQWIAIWETVLRTDPSTGNWDVTGQLLCAWNPVFVSN